MAKQKNKPKKKQASKSEKKPVEQTSSEENKTFDFGGLPSRDLKKNLGCG